MGFLTIPALLLLVFAPSPSASETVLADFARFNRAINQRIAIVEADGTVREGILRAASASEVTMSFGAGERTFSRDTIVSADRMRDGRKDGAIKGAVFGAVVSLVIFRGYEGSDRFKTWASSMATYAAIGYALDAAQTHREPIYKSASAPAAAFTMSLRF